jgi:uncharacterized protein (TIGR00299 family) protein
MRSLIFDPFAGASGDMILGALLDLGLPAQWLAEFVASLGLPEVTVHTGRANRRGIDCGRVTFELPEEHAHRHLRHVLEIVERTPAPESVRVRAGQCFGLIADAEAKIHGTTREKVHFHEVGALDAILDVLCAMAAVEELGFKSFHTRPVAMGSGWIDIAHGRFPVPAPATLELLHGVELTGFELEGECTTPTGAAIIAVLTEGRPAPARFTTTGTGFGAGTRDPQDRPNCLRLIAAVTEGAADRLYLVQTDIDDMTPEYVAAAQAQLLASGALDVTMSPVSMKKGRSGLRLELLVTEAALSASLDALFKQTTTIGARYWPVERPSLVRAEEVVQWNGQRIRLKRVRLPGGGTRSKPEYDDVVAAAAALGISPTEVRRALESHSQSRSDTPNH